jgi:hypothetical protein
MLIPSRQHYMHMKFQTVVIAAIILILTPNILFGAGENTADERIRAHFGISKAVHLSQSSIREAVLQKIPIGTPELAIRQRLKDIGIGSNSLSHYYPIEKNRKATIRVEYDPNTLDVVKKHYGIQLSFDSEMKLNDVMVDIWLTGL